MHGQVVIAWEGVRGEVDLPGRPGADAACCVPPVHTASAAQLLCTALVTHGGHAGCRRDVGVVCGIRRETQRGAVERWATRGDEMRGTRCGDVEQWAGAMTWCCGP